MTIASSKNPMRRWPKSWRALEMLAGCPGGATGPMLESHGFVPETLIQLVADGFAQSYVRRLTIGITIPQYVITAEGRKALESRK